jgi:hypothetical protein
MKAKILILVLALALLLAAVGVALANGGVERTRDVLSGGASDSGASGAALRATLGQPLVGVVTNGDAVALGHGFWHEIPYRIYLPLIRS